MANENGDDDKENERDGVADEKEKNWKLTGRVVSRQVGMYIDTANEVEKRFQSVHRNDAAEDDNVPVPVCQII